MHHHLRVAVEGAMLLCIAACHSIPFQLHPNKSLLSSKKIKRVAIEFLIL
jgi:hypothetical protein